MVELLTHIAKNDNEMSYLGHGPIVWCKRWNDMEWFDTTASCLHQLPRLAGSPRH